MKPWWSFAVVTYSRWSPMCFWDAFRLTADVQSGYPSYLSIRTGSKQPGEPLFCTSFAHPDLGWRAELHRSSWIIHFKTNISIIVITIIILEPRRNETWRVCVLLNSWNARILYRAVHYPIPFYLTFISSLRYATGRSTACKQTLEMPTPGYSRP